MSKKKKLISTIDINKMFNYFDPNKKPPLCPECARKQREHWDKEKQGCFWMELEEDTEVVIKETGHSTSFSLQKKKSNDN